MHKLDFLLYTTVAHDGRILGPFKHSAKYATIYMQIKNSGFWILLSFHKR